MLSITDGAWPTKVSGRSYNSNCCYARLVGGETKKLISSIMYCRVCQTCTVAERKGKKAKAHNCVKNYEGISKGMESSAILHMAVNAPKQGFVWLSSSQTMTVQRTYISSICM